MKITDYMEALPDSFQKTAASNNYKLLDLEWQLVSDLRTDIQAVQDTADIFQATGKTLDEYGKIYNQSRGSMTDEQYRYIILQKVARCMGGGDYNSVVSLLSVAFGVQPADFLLSETENPCEVKLTDLPFSVLNRAGTTVKQIRQIVSAVLPICVRLTSIELSGTLEFSEDAETQDNDKGFGDIEQTVGGYFGYLGTDDIDIPV